MTPEINPAVYPTVYHVAANLGGEISEIEFSDSFKELNLSGKLPFDQEMDGTNCYCGFDPNKENNYVGAVNYGCIQFDPNNIRNVNVVSRQHSEQINYRLVIKANNSYGSEPLTNRKIRYTNNVEPLTTLENTPYTLACAPSQTLTFTPDGFYSQVFRQYPITKIDYDKLVIYPMFQTYELSFTYDSDGDIVGIVEDARHSYQYADIKPEDKTPAGQYYDQDLWERGYKDTFEVVDGVNRLTKRVIVTNADCSPCYGKSSRTVIGYTDFSQGWNADGNKVIPQDGLYTWYGIAPMVEIVDGITGSIFYEDIPGLIFPRHDAYGWTNYSEGFNFRAGFTSFYFSYPVNTMMNYPDNATMEAVILNNDENDIENSYTFITSHSTNFAQDFTNQTKTRVYYLGDNGGIFSYTNDVSHDSYNFSILIPKAFPIKDLMSSIASLGLFIASDYASAYTVDITTSFPNTMYHGNIDENGITDGTWVQGEDIEDVPKHKDIEYDPIKPVPPGPTPGPSDKDEGTIGINIPGALGATNAFVSRYVLNTTQIRTIGRSLWSTIRDGNQPTWENFFMTIAGTDKIDYSLTLSEIISYFISLKYFPFSLNSISIGTGLNGIKVGTGASVIDAGSATKTLTDSIIMLDGGTCAIPNKWGNYLDIEPYTTATIYIPYCGTTELPMSVITGAQLGIDYLVDITTGAMTAVVTKYSAGASFPIATMSGSCGFDILMTGTNGNSQMTNAITNLASKSAQWTGNILQSGLTGIMSGVGGGSGMGALSSMGHTVLGIGQDMIQNNIQMPKLYATAPMIAGSSSSLSSLILPQIAYIQIRRHNPYSSRGEAGTYKDDIGPLLGYRSSFFGKVGSANGMGFVKCINPILNEVSSKGATEQEIQMIRKLLSDGIYT